MITFFKRKQNLQKEGFPIFLFGSGRSGTTLLLRILNSIDGANIWGEHGWFLKNIADSYFLNFENPLLIKNLHLSKNTKEIAMKEIKNPNIFISWTNWFGKEDYKKNYARFIKSFFNPDNTSKYWGFKEIRYCFKDRVSEMLIDLFPNAKFIFIVRNPLDTLSSQEFTFDAGTRKYFNAWILKWRDQNRFFMEFKDKHKENCFIIRFEDLINKKSGSLEKLFRFLNLPLTSTQFSIIDKKEGRGASTKEKKDELTEEEKGRIRTITNNVAFKLGYGNFIESRGIISRKNKFIYFPIPKVGCTSLKLTIADLLKLKDSKNKPHQIKFETVNVFEEKQFPGYFKFAFVRNPWDRIASCYANKIRSIKLKKEGFEKGILSSLIHLYGDTFYAGMSFEEFVEKICKIPDSRADGHFRSQHTFICDKDGKPIVDFIGRLENFKEDFKLIGKKIKKRLKYFHKNKTTRKPYQEFYNEKTKKLIEERYRKDIELFGYKFDD